MCIWFYVNMAIYSMGTRVGCLMFSFTIYIIGTVGNILIMWTIAKVKHMRTVQNLMVALLAAVDLLICGYLLPFSMHVLIANREPERQLCRFQAIITAFLFSCSIEFLMFIAIARYVKICHSHKFNSLFTVKNVILAAFVGCIVAATFSSSLWFSDELWIFEKDMHMCIFNRYGNIVFSVVFMFSLVVLPTGVTGFCYIQIYRYVSKANKELHKHWNNGLARRRLKYEQMLTKSQFAVFIAYMFMYFPFGITAVSDNRTDFPDIMHTVSIYMCYFNSCINCVLYGVLNTNMRKAYLESLPCIIRKQKSRIAPITVSGNMSVNARRPTTTITEENTR